MPPGKTCRPEASISSAPSFNFGPTSLMRSPVTATSAAPRGRPAETIPADDLSDDRSVEVRGEIVDSKCFLGVMVPGSGMISPPDQTPFGASACLRARFCSDTEPRP